MTAVVSVHPLLHSLRREPPPDGALRGSLPHRLLGALVAAVLRDALVSPADVVAATSVLAPTRFLLAPMRAHEPRDKTAHALAGASLGGFGGYLDEGYRRHDFQLGRSNTQWALRHELTLPEKPSAVRWLDRRAAQCLSRRRTERAGTADHPVDAGAARAGRTGAALARRPGPAAGLWRRPCTGGSTLSSRVCCRPTCHAAAWVAGCFTGAGAGCWRPRSAARC